MRDTPRKPIQEHTPRPEAKMAEHKHKNKPTNSVVDLKEQTKVIATQKIDERSALKKYFKNENNFVKAIYSLTQRGAQLKFSKEADLFLRDLVHSQFIRADHKIFETLTYILVLYNRHLDFLIANNDSQEPIDEKILLDTLVASMIIASKTSISDPISKFRYHFINAYISRINVLDNLLNDKKDVKELAPLRELIKLIKQRKIAPELISLHFRKILINSSCFMKEEEVTHINVLLLIAMGGYLESKTLVEIEKQFLINLQWGVAVLSNEQEFYDFISQFREYTAASSNQDGNALHSTVDIMLKFEKTLKNFGRESADSSKDSQSSETHEMQHNPKRITLSYEFKKMPLETTLNNACKEEDIITLCSNLSTMKLGTT